jgi:hypothetical protein
MRVLRSDDLTDTESGRLLKLWEEVVKAGEEWGGIEDWLIYGGAIRDAIAGTPCGRDIDIIVNLSDYTKLTKKGWVEVPAERLGYIQNVAGIIEQVRPGKREMQFILPAFDGSPAKVALELLGHAAGVDFRCCGICMSKRGDLLEVVDGAFLDCRNRLLVENDHPRANRGMLSIRAEKLKERGWKTNGA